MPTTRKQTIKHGDCEKCETCDVYIYKFKREWICRNCLNPPTSEVNIEDCMPHTSSLISADIWLP